MTKIKIKTMIGHQIILIGSCVILVASKIADKRQNFLPRDRLSRDLDSVDLLPVRPERIQRILRRSTALIIFTTPGNGSVDGSEVVVDFTNLQTSLKFVLKFVGGQLKYEIPNLNVSTWYGIQFISRIVHPFELAYPEYKLVRTMDAKVAGEAAGGSAAIESFEPHLPVKLSLLVYRDGIRAYANSPFTEHFDILVSLTSYCKDTLNSSHRIHLSTESPYGSVLVIEGSNLMPTIKKFTNSTISWLEVYPAEMNCHKVCWRTWVVSKNYHESFPQDVECQLMKANGTKTILLPSFDEISVGHDDVAMVTRLASRETIGDDSVVAEMELIDLTHPDDARTLRSRHFLFNQTAANHRIGNLKRDTVFMLRYRMEIEEIGYESELVTRLIQTGKDEHSNRTLLEPGRTSDQQMQSLSKSAVSASRQTINGELVVLNFSSRLVERAEISLNFTFVCSQKQHSSLVTLLNKANRFISISIPVHSANLRNISIDTGDAHLHDSKNEDTHSESLIHGIAVGRRHQLENATECKSVCWRSLVMLRQYDSEFSLNGDCFPIESSGNSKSSGVATASSCTVPVVQLAFLLLLNRS